MACNDWTAPVPTTQVMKGASHLIPFVDVDVNAENGLNLGACKSLFLRRSWS